MCKLARVPSWLTIFLTAELCRKRAKLSNIGEKMHKKMGTTDQLRYNGLRVITAIQCMANAYNFFMSK